METIHDQTSQIEVKESLLNRKRKKAKELTAAEQEAYIKSKSDLKDFGLLLIAALGSIIGGIGALGMFSSLALEDGGALFFSIAAIILGAVTYRIAFRNKPEFVPVKVTFPQEDKVFQETFEENVINRLQNYKS